MRTSEPELHSTVCIKQHSFSVYIVTLLFYLLKNEKVVWNETCRC